MMKIKRINHIAIVVDDFESALTFWRDALGLEIQKVEEVPEQQVSIAFIPLGETEIELVKPTANDSGIYKYLQKHGPGMHHICLEVEDIEAVLASLRAKHIRLVDEEPLISKGGMKYAFIHPKSTHGVLVELYEQPTI
ncbi:MAG TPA: methylmalonyl-CoA epimerase [Anaerolineae bacterium]|nr:methylmalonyl-CoA epimerase [Anaerolineae bacterium]